ncbi:MAG: hypothetical protein ACREYC_26350, partial [Gammaproteobacteria bacterium]
GQAARRVQAVSAQRADTALVDASRGPPWLQGTTEPVTSPVPSHLTLATSSSWGRLAALRVWPH